MEIIYKFTATDGKAEKSSLSHYTHSYSVYPYLFVADCSRFSKWDVNGEIWE